MHTQFRINNLDLIRLFAATQVAITHATYYYGVEDSDSILYLFRFFPGVPIFFFVSGFLISKSYEHNPNLKQYAQNRSLRIYPALIVCTILSMTSVYLTGYFDTVSINPKEFIAWFFGQISFVQFYNPEFMRGFGTGVLNGALWTICVELQFYILVPLLYKAFQFSKKNAGNKKLIALIFVFMAINMARFAALEYMEEVFLYKLFSVTFIPWFYMFLIGVLFQRNFDTIIRIINRVRLPILVILYIAFSIITTEIFDWRFGNGIAPPAFLFLCLAVMSLAYSYPTLGRKLLKGNDISYGIYIYHIPITNIIMYNGYGTNLISALSVVISSILMGFLSWIVIERKFISLKKSPLNPLKG